MLEKYNDLIHFGFFDDPVLTGFLQIHLKT